MNPTSRYVQLAFAAKPRQRGIALLIVMWACTLLAIMLGGYAMLARTEALQARHAFGETRAYYAAEAGVMLAIYGLQTTDPTQHWLADDRNHPLNFDGASVQVTVQSESGKVDLNSAAPQVLDQLLLAVGAPSEQAGALAQQIANWRNFGISPSDRQNRRQAYLAAGLDYGPRNGPFASIDEVQMVLGMTPALYSRIAPELTIWSYRNGPNINFASILGLQATGLTLAQAQSAFAARMNAQANPDLAVGSGPTNSIRSEAVLTDGTRAVLLVTIRTGFGMAGARPYQVLRWQEGGSG